MALAYSRFDRATRDEARAEYLESISGFRDADGRYTIPGDKRSRLRKEETSTIIGDGLGHLERGDAPARAAIAACDGRGDVRVLGHRLVDQLAELLESVPNRPITHDESPSAVRDALDLKGSATRTRRRARPSA